MPSPLAHMAVGSLLAFKAAKSPRLIKSWWRILLVGLFFSMAPDLDILVAMLAGDMGRFHNNMSHSPIFGFLFCLVTLPVVHLFLGPSWTMRNTFILALSCYGLHLLMDWFTYGRGLMLLWPVSEVRFRSPLLLFYGVRWSDGLFSPLHFITVANEGIYIAAALWFLRKKRIKQACLKLQVQKPR